MERAIRIAVGLEKDPLRRTAPQTQIDRCLGNVGPKVHWTLAWGVVHAIFAYLAVIVVIWGRDYRRRLLEIRECEESRNLSSSGRYDGVGLLLGTAPVGRLSSRRVIGSRESTFERRRGSEDDRSPLTGTTEEQNGAGIIIRISGTATSYENQGNRSPISQLSRTGSMASTMSDVSSMGFEISVEGQSFVTTSR